MVEESVALYAPSEAMEARIVQVPGVTKATSPVEESMVHTPVVVLVYVLVPAPAEAVDVIVGPIPVEEYEDV